MITALPNMINKMSARTLTNEKKNSVSANILTEKKLVKKIKIIKSKPHDQIGILGNQFCMIRPAAVNSEPKTIVQVNQYKIATKKPVAGSK